MAHGVGITPAPPQAGVIRELLLERMAEDSRAQFAATIAPGHLLPESAGHAGTYPVDTGYYGLDLSRDPDALDPVSLSATNYLDEELSFSTRPYAIGRYQVGRYDLPRRKGANLLSTSGIDAERLIVSKFAAKASAIYYQQVIARLNDAGSYAANHSYDPGDLSVTSFNLASAMEIVIGLFSDAQVDLASTDLVLVAAPAVMAAMRNLDQIRAWAGRAGGPSPNTNFETIDAVSAWLQDYLGARSVTAIVDRPRYRNTSGTSVNGLTAASAVFAVAAGGTDRSFLKTLTVAGDEELFSLRPEEVPAFDGTRFYCDMYHEVNLVDTSAAVRWTGALS